MAQMFNISDNESETSEDREDSGQTDHNRGLPQRKQHLSVPESLKGESVSRACGRVGGTHFISAVSWIHITAHLQEELKRESQTVGIGFKPNLLHMRKYLK